MRSITVPKSVQSRTVTSKEPTPRKPIDLQSDKYHLVLHHCAQTTEVVYRRVESVGERVGYAIRVMIGRVG